MSEVDEMNTDLRIKLKWKTLLAKYATYFCGLVYVLVLFSVTAETHSCLKQKNKQPHKLSRAAIQKVMNNVQSSPYSERSEKTKYPATLSSFLAGEEEHIPNDEITVSTSIDSDQVALLKIHNRSDWVITNIIITIEGQQVNRFSTATRDENTGAIIVPKDTTFWKDEYSLNIHLDSFDSAVFSFDIGVVAKKNSYMEWMDLQDKKLKTTIISAIGKKSKINPKILNP